MLNSLEQLNSRYLLVEVADDSQVQNIETPGSGRGGNELSKELSRARKARRLLESDKTVDVRHPKLERFDKEKTKFQKQGKSKPGEIKQNQFNVLNGENKQEAVIEMEMDWNRIEKSNKQELETKQAERNKQVRIEKLKNENLKEEIRGIEANDEQLEAAKRLQKEMLQAGPWDKIKQKRFESRPRSLESPNDGCKYKRLEKVLGDKDKGSILALVFVSYTECESKCDNNKECMNFEYCPKKKMCRLFDAKIRNAQNLKQQQWFDCFANYATCAKGKNLKPGNKK